MKLYDEVHTSLVKYCRAVSKTREDAKDLVSDTILAAYEKFHTVRNRQAFLSYLFTIADRIHKRRRWRMRLFGEYDSEKAELIPGYFSSPDTGADVEILYNALAKLPDKTKNTLILFEISGLSLEEIKEIQGGSLSGVKSRLVRGREMLKDLLKDKGDLQYQHNNHSSAKESSIFDNEEIEAGVL
ncbi:RNA polymerase sigma factor [Candidatus Kapaibacterium sp.]